MHSNQRKTISKYLSLLLRHQPHIIGLQIDPQGWADVQELIDKSQQNGKSITLQQIQEVIRRSEKDRFTLSRDQSKIRANYGHSINIYPDYHPQEPLDYLYHGTARKNLSAIEQQGLTPQSRQFVHLSPDYSTALSVGKRYGEPVVLVIQAQQLYEQGQPFYQAGDDVWLSEKVPPAFIIREEEQ